MNEKKPYLERIQDAINTIKEVYPGLYNTGLEYKEGMTVILNIIHREANVDKALIVDYLNKNTELKICKKKKKTAYSNQ